MVFHLILILHSFLCYLKKATKYSVHYCPFAATPNCCSCDLDTMRRYDV